MLTLSTVGLAFTVIVNGEAAEVQPKALAVTVKLDVISFIVLFEATKLLILPEPVEANPIAVLEFVQLKVAPETLLVNTKVLIVLPLHTVVLVAPPVTFTCGFTVNTNDLGEPLHPFNRGVTLTVPDIGELLRLVPVNELMFPLPVLANPIPVLELVQLKIEPAVPEKVMGEKLLEEQTD